MDDFTSGLRHVPFAHGRFFGVREATVAQIERVVAKLAHHGELGFGFGQRKADTLILRQRRAESFAFLHICPSFVHGGLRRAQTLQPNQRSGIVEACHDRAEGTILLGHEALRRDEDIVKEDRPAPNGLGADIVEMGSFDALFVQVHKKRTDPPRTALGITRTGKDHRRISLRSKAHRGLLAIQSPAVTGLGSPKLQVRRIGPAARLGQSQPDHRRTRRDTGHPILGDFRGGVLRDHAAH